MGSGIVYIVGSGPGDKGLITVKGAKILSQCDVVVYDYLCGKEVLEYCKDECHKICAEEFSQNHTVDRVGKMYEFIIEKVREGKRVVRLKGGDPSIFARLEEEEKILKENNIEYRVIPGVTASSAGACMLGIPLTSRNYASKLTIITGHEFSDKSSSLIDWKRFSNNETIVIYMGVERISDIVHRLVNISGLNPKTPVAVIQNISKINQKFIISSLDNVCEDVRKNDVKPPAIFIVGEVVKYSDTLNWYKTQKKILFTGISEERFFEEGIIFHIPMVKIIPLEDYSVLRGYISRIVNEEFDWIVFCSRYGVIYFFKNLFEMGFDTRVLSKLKFACVGSSTANMLKNYGIVADLVPKDENSEGLVRAFESVDRARIFMPRSDLSDKGLKKSLSELGFYVEECIVYKNIIPEDLPDIDFSLIDEIIFTSPSTVRNFVRRYGKIPDGINIRWIGPKTEAEVRKYISY